MIGIFRYFIAIFLWLGGRTGAHVSLVKQDAKKLFSACFVYSNRGCRGNFFVNG